MEKFEWDDQCSVHIKEIDDQHKEILDIISRVEHLSNSGKMDELPRILDEMVDYFENHFSTEEYYLSENNYPDYDNHRKLHQQFIERTLDFHTDYRDGKQTLTDEMLSFLKDWWSNHILYVDKRYAEYFAGKGIR